MAKKRIKLHSKDDLFSFDDFDDSELYNNNIFATKYCDYDELANRKVCKPLKKNIGCGMVEGEYELQDHISVGKLHKQPNKTIQKDTNPTKLIFGDWQDMGDCGFIHSTKKGLFNNFGDTPYRLKDTQIFDLFEDNKKLIVLNGKYLVPIEPLRHLWYKDKDQRITIPQQIDVFFPEQSLINKPHSVELENAENLIGFRNRRNNQVMFIEAIPYQGDSTEQWKAILNDRLYFYDDFTDYDIQSTIMEFEPEYINLEEEDSYLIEYNEGLYPISEHLPLEIKESEFKTDNIMSPRKKVFKIGDWYYQELTSMDNAFNSTDIANEYGMQGCFSDKSGRIFCRFDFDKEINIRQGHPDDNLKIGHIPFQLVYMPTESLKDIIDNNKDTINPEIMQDLQNEIYTRRKIDNIDGRKEKKLRNKLLEIEQEILDNRINYYTITHDVDLAMRSGKPQLPIDLIEFGKQQKVEGKCSVNDQKYVYENCEPTMEGFKVVFNAVEEIEDRLEEANERMFGLGKNAEAEIVGAYLVGGYVDNRHPIVDNKPEVMISVIGNRADDVIEMVGNEIDLNFADVHIIEAKKPKTDNYLPGNRVKIPLEEITGKRLRGIQKRRTHLPKKRTGTFDTDDKEEQTKKIDEREQLTRKERKLYDELRKYGYSIEDIKQQESAFE